MYAGVISKFVDRMTAGEIPLIFGDGQQTRDFCFVGDVVDANLLAMRAPADRAGWPINIGTGRRTSLLDLVRSLNRVLGASLQPAFCDERAGDVRHSVADITRAQTWLGYAPKTSLDDGLTALVDSVTGGAR
jgi:UDP-glucose 4-epimerase